MSRRNIALLLSSAMLACALGSFSGATMVMAEEAGTASSGDAALTVGLPQDLDNSLDPYQITAAGTREVLFNVYEGLVKPDTDGNFVDAVASMLNKEKTASKKPEAQPQDAPETQARPRQDNPETQADTAPKSAAQP